MLKNLFQKCQCAAVNEKQSIQKTSIKKNGYYLFTGCNWPAFE